MRLPRGGDHSTAGGLVVHFGVSPDFFRDPRRGCAPGKVRPDLFFERDTREKARQICRRCTVQPQCDAWATANRERWGVWGARARDPRTSRILAETDTL